MKCTAVPSTLQNTADNELPAASSSASAEKCNKYMFVEFLIQTVPTLMFERLTLLCESYYTPV